MEIIQETTKKCKRCGFTAPEKWFVKNTATKGVGLASKTYNYRQSVCPMCQQEVRDERKWQDRAVVKARNMIYNHAKKFGMATHDFAEKYSWDIKRIAHDINHSYENGCHYCGQTYKEMGHGLRDLTLDVINPDDEPYYANVRYCCQTCNSSKGHRGAEEFGFHLAMVKQRETFLEKLKRMSWGSELKPQFRMDSIFN